MDEKKLEEECRAFEKSIAEVVQKYIDHEEAYTDNVQLQIRVEDLDVCLADPEQDLPNCDYYPVMDLVRGSADTPGQWEPDPEAISEVAAEYIYTDD